jgi:hypothetical protein
MNKVHDLIKVLNRKKARFNLSSFELVQFLALKLHMSRRICGNEEQDELSVLSEWSSRLHRTYGKCETYESGS